MIPTYLAYQEEMKSLIRGKTHVRISYGIRSDIQVLNHSSYASYLGSGTLQGVLVDDVNTSDYAYLAKNYMRTNGSQKILPQNLSERDNECGFIFNDFSSADKSFVNDVFITLDLIDGSDTVAKTIPGIVLTFDEANDTYPTEIELVAKNGAITTYEETLINDSNTLLIEKEMKSITSITLHFKSINKANALLRITGLFIGLSKVFTNKDLSDEGLKYTRSISMVSNELSYTEMKFTVNDYELKFNPYNPEGIYKYFSKRQPVKLEIGRESLFSDEIYWLEVANLLTDNLSFKENTFTIECIDLLSSLDDINTFTKSHDQAILNTWNNMIADLCNSDDISLNQLVLPDSFNVDNATAGMPEVLIAEAFQLIANINNMIVYTNRDGFVQFDKAWVPKVNVYDNGHVVFSDVARAYNDNQLPLVSYAQLTSDFLNSEIDSFIVISTNDKKEMDIRFVSESIADDAGVFTDPIVISVDYSMPVSVDSIYLVFDHLKQEYASDFDIKYYDPDGVLMHTESFSNNLLYEVSKSVSIDNCSKVELIINKWSVPGHRAIVNRVGSGRMLNYMLDFDDIKVKPEIKDIVYVKAIKVTYHDYVSSIDSVETVNFNDVGKTIEIDNPLCSTAEQAKNLAVWFYNFIKNGNSINIDYRGDPAIEPFDYIYIESQFKNKMPVCVSKVELNVSNGLDGKIEVISI